MEIAVGTHPGVWQKNGGDAALAEALAPNVTLLAVADGFGSISRGLSIAQSALFFVRDFLRRKARSGAFTTRGPSSSARRQLVLGALSYANSRLFSQSASHDDYVAGGTSVTAALLVGEHAFVGHVGTSRAYLLRNDALEVVTCDDAFDMVPLENGRSSVPAGLHVHTMVTRTLGTQPTLEASVLHVEIAPADRLLLCTSGFHRRVETDEIHHTLRMSDSVADVVSNLLTTAKARRLEHGSVVVATAVGTPLANADVAAIPSNASPGRSMRALAFTIAVALLFGLATAAELWR